MSKFSMLYYRSNYIEYKEKYNELLNKLKVFLEEFTKKNNKEIKND